MAATDGVEIVRLQPGDASAALALSSDAQWNQIDADWRFFLARGIVYGIFERDVGLVATAALLPYAESHAWISMVLVTASRQRRGLATRLVDACIEEATKQKRTAWLDATPAGAAVYGALGFTPTGSSQRMRLAGAAAPQAPLPAGNVDDLLARDACAFGLLDAIVKSEAGPLLLDASGDQNDFVETLTASGWTAERPFQRMRFGLTDATGSQPAFAGAGPEYG